MNEPARRVPVISLALLRGINVGGKNKVDMRRLKATFEGLGLSNVRTYINSGNVIFDSLELPPESLPGTLERAVRDEFGVDTPILVRDLDSIRTVVAALPDDWVNDGESKCDVLFLWPELDHPGVVDRLPTRSGIDDVRYTPGAVLWRVDRAEATRSGLPRIVGTDLYRMLTVRNCNTVRKLAELMVAGAS